MCHHDFLEARQKVELDGEVNEPVSIITSNGYNDVKLTHYR
jgi:hypothetical protein